MEKLTEMITEYWEKNGFNSESTINMIEEIKEALSEQAISADIDIEDENQYDEE